MKAIKSLFKVDKIDVELPLPFCALLNDILISRSVSASCMLASTSGGGLFKV